jgi:hypothetical protein
MLFGMERISTPIRMVAAFKLESGHIERLIPGSPCDCIPDRSNASLRSDSPSLLFDSWADDLKRQAA